MPTSKSPHAPFEPQFIAADDYHPEFGYLCPSPRMRRTLRMTMAAAILGLAVGAVTMLAVEHRPSRDASSNASTNGGAQTLASATAVTPAAVEPFDPQPAVLPQPTANPRVASVAATDSASATRPVTSCWDLAGSFLDVKCQARKQRKARAARSSPRSFANVLLGHAGDAPKPQKPRSAAKVAATEAVPAPAPKPTPTTAPKPAQAAAPISAPVPAPTEDTLAVSVPATAAATPAQPAVAPAKKPVKVAKKKHRREDVAIQTYAAVPPPLPMREPFGLFRDGPRFGSNGFGGLY